MAALVREGVEAGALGFSSSKTLLHKDVHGEYMPGTFSGNDEMLVKNGFKMCWKTRFPKEHGAPERFPWTRGHSPTQP